MQPHAIHWFEIPVTDMNRAQAFYEAMTGQRLKREPFGQPGQELAVFDHYGPDAVSGALCLMPQMQPCLQGSCVYLNAAPALGDWLARVPAAGGAVLMPRTELPGGLGFIALIRDSEGNRVGLHAMQ